MEPTKPPAPPEHILDILKDTIFLQYLKAEIMGYKYRSPPPGGCKWKRTPIDHLREAGMFNSPGLIEEYKKIALRTSPLPSGQRNAIANIIHTAIKKMYEEYQRKNQNSKETKKEDQP